MVMISKYLRKRLHYRPACQSVPIRAQARSGCTFKLNDVETEILSPATTTYWDPTEPTATRPLAFTDHTAATPATYFYTHDLTKNVCEILNNSGSIVTTYDYTPFGAVTASNSATQNTFMFSSEVLDPETSLVYYNYRHYNPLDGRWISRDPIEEDGGWNLMAFLRNNLMHYNDFIGLYEWIPVKKRGGCFNCSGKFSVSSILRRFLFPNAFGFLFSNYSPRERKKFSQAQKGVWIARKRPFSASNC